MNQRPCSNCSSMVVEAKAFCPECGSSMEVEEERQGASEFDQFDETIHYGETAYGMLMEQMELDVSRAPESEEELDGTVPDEIAETADPGNKRIYLFIGIVASIMIIVILVFLILGAYFVMS